MVRSEQLRTFFYSPQSQESKSEVGLCNKMRQCTLGPILRPTLYLWCPWSNPTESTESQESKSDISTTECAMGNGHSDPS